MKSFKKILCATISLVIVFLLSVNVCYAENINAFPAERNYDEVINWQVLSAYTADYPVVIDNWVANLTDVNGNYVQLFNLEGTIYVPLRAVSQSFGVNVDWNGNNFSVILTSTDNEPDKSKWVKYSDFTGDSTGEWTDLDIAVTDIAVFLDGERVTLKTESGDIVKPVMYNDSTYVPMRAISNTLSKNVSWDGRGVIIESENNYENMKKKYQAYRGIGNDFIEGISVEMSYSGLKTYDAFDDIIIRFARDIDESTLKSGIKIIVNERDRVDSTFDFYYNKETFELTLHKEGEIYFDGTQANVALFITDALRDTAGNPLNQGMFAEFIAQVR